MAYTIHVKPTTNAQTFEESYEALDDDGETIDLTGSTIVFNVQDPVSGASVLRATNDDGITITTTVFTVRFEVESMTGIEPKNYLVGCTILLGGDTIQPFEGTLQVNDGRMQ